MKSILRRILPEPVARKISDHRKTRYYRPALDQLRLRNSRKIILFGTPEHGNLGDHLITEGELKFFQDHFSDHQVIEITGDHFRFQRQHIIPLIHKDDIIVITGGGFLGSLWMNEEEMVRDILENFKQNKIVVFPSTIYFENDDHGIREFDKSRRVYRQHDDLSVCVRDEKSMAVAKKLLGESKFHKITYTPDIALYLNESQESSRRQDILFCVREDKEKILSNSDMKALENRIGSLGIPMKKTNTVVPRHVTKEKRMLELQALVREFKEARVVITDRLHGMILAAITGTPCIALDNSSGKVKGVYSWIRHLGYITFADHVDDVFGCLDQHLSMGGQPYSNEEMIPAFSKIEALLRDKVE